MRFSDVFLWVFFLGMKVSKINSNHLHCNKVEGTVGENYLKTCQFNGTLSSEKERVTITKVLFEGENRSENQHPDITGVRSLYAKLHFFPQRLEYFFPNLEYLSLKNASIKEITKFDLIPLKKLKILYLSNNDLKALESELFVGNSNLEVLHLDGNQIAVIEPEAFTGLTKLKKLSLELNVCTNGKSSEIVSVPKLIEDSYKRCKKVETNANYVPYIILIAILAIALIASLIYIKALSKRLQNPSDSLTKFSNLRQTSTVRSLPQTPPEEVAQYSVPVDVGNEEVLYAEPEIGSVGYGELKNEAEYAEVSDVKIIHIEDYAVVVKS